MTERAGAHPEGGVPSSSDAPAQPPVPLDEGLVGHEHLPTLLRFLEEAVYLFDREGNLMARLSQPGGLLGYDLEVGANVFTHIHPDDLPRGIRFGAEAQEAQAEWVGEMSVRLRHADGTWRRYLVRLRNRFDDPTVQAMVATMREEPERNGVPAPSELGAIAEDLPTAYLALGGGGRIRFASEAATELLRSPIEALVGLPIDELFVDRDQPAVLSAYDALRTSTGARTVVAASRVRFGGRLLEAEFHTRGTDAEHKVVTVVLVDHTEEPELVRLATRDALTGLANRTKVLDTINGLLLGDDPTLSVVYVDLDDLKGINDAHGHEAGDRALVVVAQRLQELVRPTDLVGRLSGDEFAIVCPRLDGQALLRFVERVGANASHPAVALTPGGEAQRLAVSAGGATAVAGDTTASLLRRADEAMFEAKRARPR